MSLAAPANYRQDATAEDKATKPASTTLNLAETSGENITYIHMNNYINIGELNDSDTISKKYSHCIWTLVMLVI